jgi:hypothetical protein
MLHETVRMTDIDVDHWRNLQSLLLVSAKARPRIVVIHEQGEVLSVAHSGGERVTGAPLQIEDPPTVARGLHEANSDVDLVAVFERDAVDSHFAAMGASWNPDEDLDDWVRRLYGTLDRDDDGIVTHPGPASQQLGLQWRIGVSYAQLHSAVERHVAADSSVAFAVLDHQEVWATLVVGFDDDQRVTVTTTADPSAPLSGSTDEILDGLIALAQERHGPCALAVAIERADAEALLRDGVTEAALREWATVRRSQGLT